MGDTVIRAANLGKRYRIGKRVRYHTLRDSLTELASRPLQWWQGRNASTNGPTDDTLWALRDLSFEVRRGEVLGIIGRNGAGKSTLLKILSRITEPTTGQVELQGRVGSLLEVGTGFHPELTGRENIFLNGAILGMKRREIVQKFDAIVAFAEIERFIDTPVKHYSSGMYTRLAFAVAAHLEPEILLVDEVLAVGDARFQKRCLGKMGQVAQSGRTVLLVSHQMSMIETLCSQAILLDHGTLKARGPTADVVRQYLHDAENTAAVDLTSMRRTGTGEIQLAKFWIEDQTGHHTTSVASGAPVTLAFEYQKPSSRPLAISLGFSIHTPNHQTVTLHYSDYAGANLVASGHGGIIRFTLARLPLAHGSYYVGVRLLANGVEADWPRDMVGRLDVEAGDYYGCGQAFHSGIAPVLLDGAWQLGAVPAERL